MKKSHTNSKILRKEAEELLKTSASLSVRSGSGSYISETDMLRLIHELEVHQIEVEMQSKELLLEKSAAKDDNLSSY